MDSNVGKHIFEKVIGPKGVLRKKTRILVTHGISFLPLVHQIVVMKEGKISEIGTYHQLLANKGAFAEFLIEQMNEQQNPNREDVDEDTTILSEVEIDELKVQLQESFGKKEYRRKMAAEARKKEKYVDITTFNYVFIFCVSDIFPKRTFYSINMNII